MPESARYSHGGLATPRGKLAKSHINPICNGDRRRCASFHGAEADRSKPRSKGFFRLDLNPCGKEKGLFGMRGEKLPGGDPHRFELEGCNKGLTSLESGWLRTKPIRIGEVKMVSPMKGSLSANLHMSRPASTASASGFSTRAAFSRVFARSNSVRFSRSFRGGFARSNPLFIPNVPGAPIHWPTMTPERRCDACANGAARGMSQRVSHGQQNAHRCGPPGRNPGGRAAR